ncbi:type I restriction enzyme M protein [Hymenobacter sp. UYAg731]
MTIEEIRALLIALDFSADAETPDIYMKTYDAFHYVISVDLSQGLEGHINYGPSIRFGDRTTTHFKADENFVVLECVDRLLRKGYYPSDIELERKFKLGRTQKSGKADICVYQHKKNKLLLIIECKTAGEAYEEELVNTQRDGGQVFSYFVNGGTAQFLALYASHLTPEGTVSYTSAVVSVVDTPAEEAAQRLSPDEYLTYKAYKEKDDLLKVWANKSGGTPQFAPAGIFEPECPAYNPGYEPRRLRDLRNFEPEDRAKVFQEFMEILRRHNVSDRSNAFNRLISLVLAKIVDEGGAPEQEAGFQFIIGRDNDERLYERLQTLYTRAMRDYLHEDVINYTQADIDSVVSAFPRQYAQEQIRRILRELKFYSNNEFAFKEVYNKTLFEGNAHVLRDMVHLFEPFRFKHNKRAAVLGELFEQLLETGYKQSEGQFFTPIPIARFLVGSLPLAEMVQEKIAARAADFLPSVIDYASGAGHFLTETLDAIQHIVNSLNTGDLGIETDIGRQVKAFQDQPMSWAGRYLHGIEKDYRLARTSKVACFMHGDGDANIIYGDGLEKHANLPANGTFDAVVANPPYAIDAFKPNLKVNADDFVLLPHITDTSGNIEVLFIERAAQLLRTGGVAALILPSSFLGSDGLYSRTRQLLLEAFEVKAMVEFSSETFLATGTNTVALFLLKRPDADVYNAGQVSKDLIISGISRDPTLDSLHGEKHLAAYQYSLGILPEQYQMLLRGELADAELAKTDIGRDYVQWLSEQAEYVKLPTRAAYRNSTKDEQSELKRQTAERLIKEHECERFRLYLLVESQHTILVRGGAGKPKQRKFLGYKFKKANRAHRLVAIRADANGNPISPLYDSTNPANQERINTHIQAALLNRPIQAIPEFLSPYLKSAPLLQCLDLHKVGFEISLRLSPRPLGRYLGEGVASTWPYQVLGGANGLCSISIGGTPDRDNPAYWEGTNPWVSVSELIGGRITETNESITDEGVKRSNVKPIPAETVLVSFKLSIGKTAIAGIPLYTNEAIAALIPKPEYNDVLLPLFLFYLLNTKAVDLSATKDTDNAFGNSLNIGHLQSASIPLPPKQIQELIIAQMQELQSEDDKLAEQQAQLAKHAGTLLKDNARPVPVREFATLCRETIASNEDNLVDFIGLQHIEKNTGQLSAEWEPSAVKSTNNVFQLGDVLYGKLRPNLNKVWLADRAGQCSTELVVLRSDYPHLLSFALRQPELVAEAETYATNSYPRIRPDQLMTLTLNLPEASKLPAIEKELTKLYAKQLELRTERADIPRRKRAIMEKHLVSATPPTEKEDTISDIISANPLRDNQDVEEVKSVQMPSKKKATVKKSKVIKEVSKPAELPGLEDQLLPKSTNSNRRKNGK